MKTYKPTSAGIRQRVSIEYKKLLTTTEPNKALSRGTRRSSGRNNQGRITMRHQGGGHKKLYRAVDFMQEKFDIPAIVNTIEYDPFRSAFIALVTYKDGEKRYVLAPKDIKVGDSIVASKTAELKVGNRMPLENIPIGYFVHNVEFRPGGGGKLARSAGLYAEVLGSANGMTDLKLSSKEMRRVPSTSFASIGQLSNPDHNLENLSKAGRSRWKGVRPTVRGSVMNPVDHPYGGGEGRQRRGTRRPKDIWGNVTGGRKTRNTKKYSQIRIVKRRPTKRNPS